jgi:hypothetical protein
MADRAVRRTGKDQHGDITSLCDDSWGSVSKWDAISHIENRTHSYHVPWQSGRTEIRVVVDQSVSGGKYLRTDRDNTTRNNLRDLPDC